MTSGQIPTLLWRDWSLAWGPDLAAIAAAGLYLTALRRVGRPWPWWRAVLFLSGIATIIMAIQSGIDAYDDELLSDHMVQHLLLLELGPMLLLLGRPTLLMMRSASPARRPVLARRIRRAWPLTHPAVCLIVFCVVVGGTHTPAFYDATLRHPLLHDTEHALYVVAGLLMWWPVIGEDPIPSHRLDGLLRLVYVSLAMLPMTILGAWLNRDPTVFYAPYAQAGRLLGISAVVDQQQAGAIMWVLGSSLMVIAGIWAAMSTLIADERRLQARERRADLATGSQARGEGR